jgi:hypothetical protein
MAMIGTSIEASIADVTRANKKIEEKIIAPPGLKAPNKLWKSKEDANDLLLRVEYEEIILVVTSVIDFAVNL